MGEVEVALMARSAGLDPPILQQIEVVASMNLVAFGTVGDIRMTILVLPGHPQDPLPDVRMAAEAYPLLLP